MKIRPLLFNLPILSLLALLAGAPVTTTCAQGTAFTYQGRLDDGDRPANGSYDFQFRLSDAATNGTQQGGLLTMAATVVSNGTFAVTLDFGDQFTGANRWLEVAVRTNGGGVFTTLNPRRQITAAPYAIRAANLTGTLPLSQLPPAVITNGANGVSISGTFSGNGAGVTNVDLRTVNSQGAIIFSTDRGVFALASSPATGPSTFPSSVTSADVNGDGKPDLISANNGPDTLTILTNNGSGGFALASSPSVGVGPQCVVSADVNGDGATDLITANINAGTLTVLTNNGSGGFVLGSSLTVGGLPRSVTSADVNGDGRVDLISMNTSSSTLRVFTNNGSGGFVLSSSPAVGSGPFSVISTDVNADSAPDLVSANSSAGTLTVLTNNGVGGFVLASSPPVGIGPQSVVSADVNSDGRPDLISANYNASTLSVLTNTGSGNFVTASSPSVGLNPYSVTSADVNADGKPDLISANYNTNSLTVLTNNGSGGFVLSSSPAVGSRPQAVTSADLNGDGRVDLISANQQSHTLTVLFNTTTSGATFTGNGSGLTSLNASNLSGAVAPGALTSVPAENLTGTVPLAQLPGAVVTNGASGVTIAGTLSGTFSGNGASVSNVNAATLNGVSSAGFWRTNGNAGANPANGSFLGTTDNQPLEFKVNGIRAMRLVGNTNGAPNVIGGSPVNFVAAGVVGATIAGGGAVSRFGSPYTNRVLGNFGSVLGGLDNTASGDSSTAMGFGSTAIGFSSTAMGFGSTAGNAYSTAMGASTTASGNYATAMGTGTIASGDGSTAMGSGTTASGINSFACGETTVASALAATAFGYFTRASGSGGTALGAFSHAAHSGTFVWSDGSVNPFSSTTNNQFLINASRGVGIGTPNPQGSLHVYGANNPTVVRVQSTGMPGFGRVEFVSNPQGDPNEWRPGYIQSTDGGGFTGGLSFVVNGTGAANKFSEIETMRIQNGRVGIGTATPVSALQVIGTVTATAFNPPSDRNLKENFTPVSPKEVLEKVAGLPISRWNFKGDAATPHVGPMAQDFHAAFSLGTDERHIATVDADGVALAAIQGLNEKLEQQRAENVELKRELMELKKLVHQLARPTP